MGPVQTRQNEAIAAARECGYIVARNNVRENRTAVLWYRECEATMRPYVRLTPRQSSATVTLDMWTVGRPMREDSVALASRVIRLRWELLPMRSRGFWTCGIWGAEVKLLKHAAYPVAADLVEIATKDTYLSLWELELAQIMARNTPGRGLTCG